MKNHIRDSIKSDCANHAFRGILLALFFFFLFVGMPLQAAESASPSVTAVSEISDVPTDVATTIGEAAAPSSAETANIADPPPVPVALPTSPAPPLTAIYLDGMAGKDSEDGASKATAVKTFEKARMLALDNLNIAEIFVINTVPVNGEISLAGTKAKIVREKDFSSYLFEVSPKAEATLSDIILDGNSEQATNTKASLIKVDRGTLTLKHGAVLTNNKIPPRNQWMFNAVGGAVEASGGTVQIEDGAEISHNSASYGGAVFIDGATLYMSGGTVAYNEAVDTDSTPSETDKHGNGGAFATYASDRLDVLYSTIHLSGGVIHHNRSENYGGAIALGYGTGTHAPSYFYMTGGSIEDNEAGAGGGGILVHANVYRKSEFDKLDEAHQTGHRATISGGTIRRNRVTGQGAGNMAFGGGGIYVNGVSQALIRQYPQFIFKNGELHLTHAIIRDNIAQLEGGGYAACPTTTTTFYLKNGVALYNNQGSGAKDLYIASGRLFPPHSGSPTYTVANTMLGGVPYRWLDDNGQPLPLNKLQGQLNGALNEELRLHTEAVGNEAAEALARVFIEGNISATRGGGIGSNGDVHMGEKDTTELSVVKHWADQGVPNPQHPLALTVRLYRSDANALRDKVLIGHEVLRPDDQGVWQPLIFTNLPLADAQDRPYIYSVEEKAIAGYAASYDGDMEHGLTITNRPEMPPNTPPENPPSTSSTPRERRVYVQKTWLGGSGEEAVIYLLADGNIVDRAVLHERNQWQHIFEHLPQRQNGKIIRYTIQEEPMADYITRIKGDDQSGFQVTNVYKKDKLDIPVRKKWIGKAAGSIEIQLYQDGHQVRSAYLNEAQGWQYIFKDMPLYDSVSGHIHQYTLMETPLLGYTMDISGDPYQGFLITNQKIEMPTSPSTSDKKETPKASYQGKEVPKTGHHAAIAWVLLFMGMALMIYPRLNRIGL